MNMKLRMPRIHTILQAGSIRRYADGDGLQQSAIIGIPEFRVHNPGHPLSHHIGRLQPGQGVGSKFTCIMLILGPPPMLQDL